MSMRSVAQIACVAYARPDAIAAELVDRVALAGCYLGLAASTVMLLTPNVLGAPCRILAH
jgi:hypothetical protein